MFFRTLKRKLSSSYLWHLLFRNAVYFHGTHDDGVCSRIFKFRNFHIKGCIYGQVEGLLKIQHGNSQLIFGIYKVQLFSSILCLDLQKTSFGQFSGIHHFAGAVDLLSRNFQLIFSDSFQFFIEEDGQVGGRNIERDIIFYLFNILITGHQV